MEDYQAKHVLLTGDPKRGTEWCLHPAGCCRDTQMLQTPGDFYALTSFAQKTLAVNISKTLTRLSNLLCTYTNANKGCQRQVCAPAGLPGERGRAEMSSGLWWKVEFSSPPASPERFALPSNWMVSCRVFIHQHSLLTVDDSSLGDSSCVVCCLIGGWE